jgi:hypothetical protein
MLPMLLISVTVLMLVTYIPEIGGAALRGLLRGACRSSNQL